jgi:hypothetical protein
MGFVFVIPIKTMQTYSYSGSNFTLDSKGNNRQHLQHPIFLVTSSFAATLQARNQKIESTSWFLNHLDVFTLKIVFAHLIFKRISLK